MPESSSVGTATGPRWPWRESSPPICWPWTKAIVPSNSVPCRQSNPHLRSPQRAEQELWGCGNPNRRIPTSPQLRLRRRNLLRTRQRSAGRFSPTWGLGRGVLTPDASIRLFRDRPVHPNSIFVDGAPTPFPQMDVWPGCRFGPTKRSTAVRRQNNYCNPASGDPKWRGTSVSL